MLNYLDFDPLTQFIVFILVSLVLLAVSRPFAQRITKEPPRKAVSDRLVGKQGVVMEDILPDKGGVVNIEGDIWRAISPVEIKKDTKIVVKKVESVKLLVDVVREDQ